MSSAVSKLIFEGERSNGGAFSLLDLTIEAFEIAFECHLEVILPTVELVGFLLESDGISLGDFSPDTFLKPVSLLFEHRVGLTATANSISVLKSNGEREVIASGFWRARGLALHPSGDVYLATETNAWDQGNSGLLVWVRPDRTVERVITGWDYPQFSAIGPDGRVYVTAARDDKLVSFDPDHVFSEVENDPDGIMIAVEKGQWSENPGGGTAVEIQVGRLTKNGSIQLDSGVKSVSMWVRIPADQVQLSLRKLDYHTPERPTPGIFELPKASAVIGTKAADRVHVIPLRGHIRCRWPMNYHTGRDAASRLQ